MLAFRQRQGVKAVTVRHGPLAIPGPPGTAFIDDSGPDQGFARCRIRNVTTDREAPFLLENHVFPILLKAEVRPA